MDPRRKQQLDWLEKHGVVDKDSLGAILPVKRMVKRAAKKKLNSSTEVDLEVDLHGMAIDEALFEVESALRVLRKSNRNTLRVIHGNTSTRVNTIQGRLRRELRTVWKKWVNSFERERENPGSTVITIRKKIKK